MRDPELRRLEAAAVRKPKLPPVSQILKGGFEFVFAVTVLMVMAVVLFAAFVFFFAAALHALIEIFQFGWDLIPDL